MKKIPFTKMSAAGNDFVIIDRAEGSLKKLAVEICDRKTGIGADGLLLLEKSRRADHKMRIINSDGSEAEMCGNGVRCLAIYIVNDKGFRKKLFSIETLAGLIQNKVKGKVASACLSNPKDYKANVGLDINGRNLNASYIDTGVPHTVVFVDEIGKIDVDTLGRAIRTHARFKPRGTNANFVEQIRDDFIKVRTFERGVEGETLACGTGSVASAIVTFLKANPGLKTKNGIHMTVSPTGGELLNISFNLKNGTISDVWLKGNVKVIARGEYYK